MGTERSKGGNSQKGKSGGGRRCEYRDGTLVPRMKVYQPDQQQVRKP